MFKINCKIITRPILFVFICSILLSLLSCAKNGSHIYEIKTTEIVFQSLESESTLTDKHIVIRGEQLTNNIEVFINADTARYRTLEIKQNSELRWESDGGGLEVTDICIDANAEIRIDISGYYEGIGVPFDYTIKSKDGINWTSFSLPTNYWVSDDEGEGNESEASAYVEAVVSEQTITDVPINKDDFKPVPACTSDYSDIIQSYEFEKELRAFIPESSQLLNQSWLVERKELEIINLPMALVLIKGSSHEFESVLERIKGVSDVEYVKTKNMFFAQVTTVNRPVYSNFNFGFVKLTDGKWYVIYDAPESSKGFYPALSPTAHPTKLDTIRFENYCTHSCDWWAEYEMVDFDFPNKAITIIE